MRNGFAGLVINENMKIYRRPRTWIFAGIMLFAILVTAIVSQQVSPEVGEGEWRQKAEEQVLQNKESLMNIEDVPGPFRSTAQDSLEKLNIRLQYHIDHNLNPFEKNSWTFVNGAAVELVPLVAMFIIIIASNVIASDFSTGTIKMMLIRPHHRWSILLSKYVATAMYTLGMLVLLLAGSWLIGNLVFGFGSMGYTNAIVSNGHVIQETASIITLQILGLEFISMIVLMSMTFMLATVFRSNALAVAIGIFIGYVVSLDMILAQLELTKYLFVTNMDLTYYLYNTQGKIEGTTFSFSIIVNSVYWLIFMITAWWIYQKRDVSS